MNSCPGPAWRARTAARVALAAAITLATPIVLAAGRHAAAGQAPEGAARTLVVCAPGYPGSTAEAQAAMDTLAAAVARASGLRPGELGAVYFETEQAGLDRLAARDAALALVPLPFWLKHRAALRLEPLMQAVEAGGEPAEAWTLVAGAGAVAAPAGLAGFELTSLAGYAPRFVRGPALGAWGEVPPDATITPLRAVLSSLRRASTGAKVAVLLNREQAAALPTLPFAARLQVVTRSAPLPVSVLAVVGGRLDAAQSRAIAKGLASLGSTAGGPDALAGVRLARFIPADQAALARAREAYDKVKE